MNFEESYEKFLNGTASEEEIKFVAEEIKKAKEIDRILNLPTDAPKFEAVSDDTVVKARRDFNRKNFVRTLIIILSSLCVIAATVCGIIFIPSTVSARQSRRYSREECTAIAIECASQYLSQDNSTEFLIRDVDRHLSLRSGLRRAVYMYEVDLENEAHEIEIYVNSSSGYAEVRDVSRND